MTSFSYIIVGFALYHRETIPAQWTTAFIKAAFGFQIVPEDMKHVDPDFYEKKIKYLKDSVYASKDGIALEDLCLSFEAGHEVEAYSVRTYS